MNLSPAGCIKLSFGRGLSQTGTSIDGEVGSPGAALATVAVDP